MCWTISGKKNENYEINEIKNIRISENKVENAAALCRIARITRIDIYQL